MATNNFGTLYPQQSLNNIPQQSFRQVGGPQYSPNVGLAQPNQGYTQTNIPQIGGNYSQSVLPNYQSPQRMVTQGLSPQILQSQSSPLINAPQMYQQNQQASVVHNVEHVPVIHELHHVNRPINVVSVDEIEGPWRSKVLLLEKQLIELQLMMKRGPQKQQQTKQIVVEDEGKIRQLQEEILRLQEILKQNQLEMDELENQIRDASYNLENADEQASASIAAQSEELARWKKKFQELNKDYHDVEEDITMTEAQIESLQKRKLVATTTSSIKTTSKIQGGGGDVRSSGFRNY